MLEAYLLTRSMFVPDGEGEFLAGIQYLYAISYQLDLTCRHIAVGLTIGSGCHRTCDLDTVFWFDIGRLGELHLRHTISIPECDECQSSHISDIIYSSRECHCLASMCRAELSAGMGSMHFWV